MPLLMCDLDDTLVERAPLFRTWAEGFLDAHAPQQASKELVDWLVEHDRAMSESYRLTAGVRSALDEVRAAGWSFAVVTNGPEFRQRPKIVATGLDELADSVCISGEVGAPKPAAVMFEEAARRAGTTLEGAWMIGDNLDADIAGAHGVGARSVWVEHHSEWLVFESGTEPDLVAKDFPDAVRHVLSATSDFVTR